MEVERLWSDADAILTKRRASTSPLLLELILYLKYNRDLWNLSDVITANQRRLAADRESRAKKRIDEVEEEEALEDPPLLM